MANPIRRLIQLVLDKASAARAEKDARKALSGIEGGLGTLGMVARRVGYAIGAAFGIRALINFGKTAVREALQSERAWSELAGTVRAAGKDFEAIQGDLRALGQAFEDATRHTNDDYAASLARMITLTGDVSASTNNMGLVANVAAQFYGGDLAPAVELVSKVMTGNITVLGKMGIHVKTAQQGLEVLASRSFGAAARQAGTFGGKVDNLSKAWNNFKQEIGRVLISSGEGADALGVLQGVVKTMTQWVKDNRDALRDWVTDALRLAQEVLPTLVKAFQGLQAIVSWFSGHNRTILADAAEGTLRSTLAILKQYPAGSVQARQALLDLNAAMADFAKRLDTPERVGLYRKALVTLIESGHLTGVALAFATDKLKKFDELVARSGKRPGTPLQLPDLVTTAAGPKPKVAAGAKPGELSEIEKALKEFDEAMASIRTSSALLGPEFDAIGAEATALTTVIQKLGAEGVGPTDQRMQHFAERLRELGVTEQSKAIAEALKTFHEAMRSAEAMSQLLGKDFDVLGARASALETVMQALAANGVKPTAANMRDFAEQLTAIQQAQTVDELLRAMMALHETSRLLGPSFDVLGGEASILSSELEKMKRTFGEDDPRVRAMATRLIELGQAIPIRDFEKGERAAALMWQALTPEATTPHEVFEQRLDRMRAAAERLRQEIERIGADPTQAGRFAQLTAQYQGLQTTIRQTALAQQQLAAISQDVAGAMVAAMTGQLGAYAAGKAQQNLLEAAELGVQAAAAAIFSLGIGTGPLLALAAQHLAIAGAWSALSAGFGGSAAQGAGGGGGGGGGGSLATARTASARDSQRAVPSQEVSIYLVGPGFNALNPEVQEVVWGAQQVARERFGKDAKIRVKRRP